MISLDINTLSKQGARHYQEDCFGEIVQHGLHCLVVADGAGGHGGGHIASHLAVRAVLDLFAQHPDFTTPSLHEMLLHAHRVVRAGQQKFDKYPDMRSTLVIGLVELSTGRAMYGNIGDSRGYAFCGGEVLRTRDHTILQQMLDAGLCDPADAPRSRVTSSLMASLGSSNQPEPYIVELPQPLAMNDCLLLCTDGWWDTLDPTSLPATVAASSNLNSALEALEGQLLLQAKADQDNYTAMLVKVRGVADELATVIQDVGAQEAPVPAPAAPATAPQAKLTPEDFDRTVIVSRTAFFNDPVVPVSDING
jgi:PPM family protein phosphatase